MKKNVRLGFASQEFRVSALVKQSKVAKREKATKKNRRRIRCRSIPSVAWSSVNCLSSGWMSVKKTSRKMSRERSEERIFCLPRRSEVVAQKRVRESALCAKDV